MDAITDSEKVALRMYVNDKNNSQATTTRRPIHRLSVKFVWTRAAYAESQNKNFVCAE